jgi:D-alanine-D-alanine ligase
MSGKLTVGILCGGRSAEHEVSLQSALNVWEALDRDKYEPLLIGIDKGGSWFLNREDVRTFIVNADDPGKIALNTSGACKIFPVHSPDYINTSGKFLDVDVVFPILHGPYGEDGTVQGLLRLAGIPFVGADVAGSAIGMDKDIMKRLLRDAGLPICKFLVVNHTNVKQIGFTEVVKTLGTPIFIKPANMGSSIGVGKASVENEYIKLLADAFRYDNKVILEQFVKGRELECSVLGNENIELSVAGEIITKHGFYSYAAKYLDDNVSELKIPADISPVVQKEIQSLAEKAFKVLCCEGLARIDFFLKDDNALVINEINTMPGFTRISMYPKLCEASGMSYKSLISRLIELALEKHSNL